MFHDLAILKAEQAAEGRSWVVYEEPSFAFGEIPTFPADKSVCLRGYFQSDLYFHTYREEVGQLLFKLPPDRQLLVANEVEKLQHQVTTMLAHVPETTARRILCVHVRRTDFNNPVNSVTYARLNENYYTSAYQNLIYRSSRKFAKVSPVHRRRVLTFSQGSHHLLGRPRLV